jgi:hypothetical protein
MKPILAVAPLVEMAIAIPEPCLIELEWGIREKLTTQKTSLCKAIEELRRLRVEIASPTVDVEAEVSRYTERVRAFLDKHRITVAPFPDLMPDVRTLFEAAARKAYPFDPSGNSYRDAVIALSVEHWVRKSQPGRVYFVSDDAKFRDLLARGAEKIDCLCVKDAVAMLEARLSDVQQRAREAVREGIRDRLVSKLKDLEALAAATVRFNLPPREYEEKVLSIDQFTATTINAIELGEMQSRYADFAGELHGVLTCAAAVDSMARAARARAIAHALRSLDVPTMVGQTGRSPQTVPPGSIPFDFEPERTGEPRDRERLNVNITLALDGTAALDDEGRVLDVTVSSMRDRGQGPMGLIA